MNKPIYFLFNFIIVIAFFSCTFFETKKAEDAIAKVGNQYLFKEDLPKFEISSSNPEDSITATKRYIDQWALKQIMLNKAKFNLPEQQQQKFEEMANQYREQLYINAYKDALVEKNFQFNINEDSIQAYYNANKDNFKLKEVLLKARYVTLQNDLQDLDEIKSKFESFTTEDQEFLENKSLEFKNFNLNDSVWIRWVDFQKKLEPIKTELNSYVDTNRFQKTKTLTDSLYTYFVYINEVKKTNEVPPLTYLKPTIQQILENKKKLDLNKQLEKEIINDAIKNNEYEIY